jgi:hypothetical protein
LICDDLVLDELERLQKDANQQASIKGRKEQSNTFDPGDDGGLKAIGPFSGGQDSAPFVATVAGTGKSKQTISLFQVHTHPTNSVPQFNDKDSKLAQKYDIPIVVLGTERIWVIDKAGKVHDLVIKDGVTALRARCKEQDK